MFPQLPLIVCVAFCGVDKQAVAEATLPAARVEMVRNMYARLPARILDVTVDSEEGLTFEG